MNTNWLQSIGCVLISFTLLACGGGGGTINKSDPTLASTTVLWLLEGSKTFPGKWTYIDEKIGAIPWDIGGYLKYRATCTNSGPIGGVYQGMKGAIGSKRA
jgi:hypothetical protein